MEAANEIILYQPDSTVKLKVRLEDETVWLSQEQMSELFQRDRTVIGPKSRTNPKALKEVNENLKS